MVYPPGLLVEEGGEPRRLAMTGNGFLAGSAGAAGGPSPAGTRTLILDRQFDADTLYTLRAAVQDHALQVGLTEDLTGDLVLAAHELAANAVAHGAGYGRLRLWHLPDALTCEIIDDGLKPLSCKRSEQRLIEFRVPPCRRPGFPAFGQFLERVRTRRFQQVPAGFRL